MMFYLLMPGDTEQDVLNEANLLGESSFGTFWAGSGLTTLMKLVDSHPAFGCDLVGGRGQISAAIADLSPVNLERTLPENYHHQLGNLTPVNFSQTRDLPEWGNIFSDFCLFIRPSSLEEELLFLNRVREFLKIHCSQAIISVPVEPEKVTSIIAGQHNYCTKQQQNDKTRRVLEKAFGEQWAENYMTTVLFDLP